MGSPFNDTMEREVIPRLDKPMSPSRMMVGWLVATLVFVGLVYFLGGPTQSDAVSTNFPTWAISQGQIACAYPPSSTVPFPMVDTLYPLVAGGISAVLGIGDHTGFPTSAQMGPNCIHTITAMTHWENKANIFDATARIALIGWLFLSVGVLAFLRTTKRKGTYWMFAALMLMAISPPILDAIYVDLHPEDFLALGFGLGAVALAKRHNWLVAGLLVGLAVTSQQFALLIAAPLFVLVPNRQKIRYALGAAISFGVVVGGLALATSGRSLKASLIGSGFTQASDGTIVTKLHIATHTELTISRALPIIISVALAWWVWRRLGEASFEPLILSSLIATSLALRITFDPNMWGYYLLASAVGIILVDVIYGRIRLSFFLWLSIILLVYGPWNNSPLFIGMPYWEKQVILIPFTLFLTSGPLFRLWRSGRVSDVDVANSVASG